MASNDAFSCTCGSEPSVKEEFINKDLIVSGKIISSEMVAFDSAGKLIVQRKWDLSKYTIRRYKLVIREVFKGKFYQDTITIYSDISDASCGYYFETGKSYLVYGMDHTKPLMEDIPQLPSGKNLIWTHLCTRTREYDEKEASKLRRLSK